MRPLLLPLLALCLASCTSPSDDPPPVVPAPVPVAVPDSPSLSPSPPHSPLDGRSFPDKVISLTWDDGPDASTLALASYLETRHVSATFFVVSSWIDGLSDEPGDGKGVFESGYEFLPVLSDLVALGHRLGNHTLHHVLLREAAGAATIDRELRENQHNLDPFLTNELRLFRAPGGRWGDLGRDMVDRDPYLGLMVGPMAWDIDRKDWDESLHCRGPRGPFECERAAPGRALRMKPSVVAARYVASIESAGHGIVLLHDRVGHVGSTYGLEIAQAMIPQLEAKGFVFAAPVLRFSPLVVRHAEADASDAHRWDAGTIRLGDVNGDGREDVCGRTAAGRVSCAVSVQTASNDRLPRSVFRAARNARVAAASATPAGTLHLADVTGDGRADVCVAGERGIACAASDVAGELGPFRPWSEAEHAASFRFADLDGDGRADACTRSASGISCAHNTGARFDAPRPWLIDSRAAGAVQLADVDGDGRADACARGESGIACALSTGKGFARLEKWSYGSDFATGDLLFGDLNGDRRQDVCSVTREGVSCALATAHGFTKATVWLTGALEGAELGDINGDGRADLCGRTSDGLACALAP